MKKRKIEFMTQAELDQRMKSHIKIPEDSLEKIKIKSEVDEEELTDEEFFKSLENLNLKILNLK